MNSYRRQDSQFMGGETAKKIKVFRNGNHSRQAEIMLKPGTSFQQLRDEIISKLALRDTGVFKLYNNEGIELYEDYIPLIRDEDHLFVSLGEVFDQNTTLAEYREVSLLGEGGFGKVMLMEHGAGGQQYAVKYVDARKYGLANLIDMVFKEAELLKNLNHKNIVQIMNFFTLKDMRVVFVMEYLKGGELGDYLQRKGRLEEDEAREIFLQLVDAVNFCHNNNIIHRDLKLENILFESKDSNNIKVVDFGIAGFYSNMKGSESSAGSLRYMAPEVLTGRNKAANPGIDIWSMGVILHTLLHGKLPFRGKTRKEIIENIVYGKHQIDPEIRKNVSLECQDLLAKMLIVDYKSRITTFEVTEHPWIKGEKNVFQPSWYDSDKLEQTKEEAKKSLLASRLGHGPGHIKSKGSLGNEKEGFKKLLELQESIHRKSNSKDLGSSKDPKMFKEKKSLMYEEAKRREKKLHTIDIIGKDDITSPLGRASKEKKLTFPCIPHTTTNAAAGRMMNKFGKKGAFF